MENKSFRIIYISEFDIKGSGYTGITSALCQKLHERGCEIKVLGLAYHGEEHHYGFSVIPVFDVNALLAMVTNLKIIWNPDVLIVALDVNYQKVIMERLRGIPIPYICIMPIENPPLCMAWAAILQQMDKALIMSEFGAKECNEKGVTSAEYLPIGIDTASWKSATPKEKKQVRDSLGIQDDEFVILTVADNQERKNLNAAMQIVGRVKRSGWKIRYVLVTREFCPVGYFLRELALDNGINSETMLFERGIPFDALWGLYAASDLFLLTSKAEGLGMPALEAMSMKIPVIATRTGALIDHLSDDRGTLIDPEYSFIDVWGNSNRDMIDIEAAVKAITLGKYKQINLDAARKYVEARTWDVTADVLLRGIEDVKEKAAQKSQPTAAEKDESDSIDQPV